MARTKGSQNKTEPVVELSLEERMEILAKLLIDTVEEETKRLSDAITK